MDALTWRARRLLRRCNKAFPFHAKVPSDLGFNMNKFAQHVSGQQRGASAAKASTLTVGGSVSGGAVSGGGLGPSSGPSSLSGGPSLRPDDVFERLHLARILRMERQFDERLQGLQASHRALHSALDKLDLEREVVQVRPRPRAIRAICARSFRRARDRAPRRLVAQTPRLPRPRALGAARRGRRHAELRARRARRARVVGHRALVVDVGRELDARRLVAEARAARERRRQRRGAEPRPLHGVAHGGARPAREPAQRAGRRARRGSASARVREERVQELGQIARRRARAGARAHRRGLAILVHGRSQRRQAPPGSKQAREAQQRECANFSGM